MFENESDKVRRDITILQRMLDFDELEANGGDLFKIEWALNTALDHIEFLKSNLPYDHMNDDIEDEVVECDALMEKATALVEACKVKYSLDNSFFRDHVTPEFSRKPVKKPKAKRLSQDSQFRLFVIILLAAIVIACLFFCD